jgi:signal transduction histidine kinase
LESSLRDILSKVDDFDYFHHQELMTNLGQCRTAIVVELQKISEWFRRSNKKYIESFDFSILLGSSVDTLKRSFLTTGVSIENTSTIKIDGDYFPYFSDILFYLLHNALKHSKLLDQDLQIRISVSQTESNIAIKVSNNISMDDTYHRQVRKKIEITKEMLSNMKSVQKVVNKEGGTGFAKIKKILSQNLARKNASIDFDMSVSGDSAFFSTAIEFEYQGLVKEE